MDYIWGAAPEPEPEPEPEQQQLEPPSNAAGSVRAMEEDLMVLLNQLQQAQQAQQELQEEVGRARQREDDAKSSAEQAYALVSEVQETFRGQIDVIAREHTAKTEAAEAEAAEAKAQLEKAQREAVAAVTQPQPGPGPDAALAAKVSLIESTLAQLEAELAVPTPPGTPLKLSDSSDEEVTTRLRRLSSTPLKLSTAPAPAPAPAPSESRQAAEAEAAAAAGAVRVAEAVKAAEAQAAAESAEVRAGDEATIAALQAELAQANAAMAEAVQAEQTAATKAAEAEAAGAAARDAAAAAAAEAAATARVATLTAGAEEDSKLAALSAELAAARSEAVEVKKSADERVAIAMSSAVMAEQQRSELQSSLNLQLAQAREEVRAEAAATQAAAVAVVATERDDAKAALLLAAKEASDDVAEAQMLQQERVAAMEKQLGGALDRAATAEGKISALMLQAASDANRIESLTSRLSMAERQAAILGARKALVGEEEDDEEEEKKKASAESAESQQAAAALDAGDLAMEREAGITNDACHASMKEVRCRVLFSPLFPQFSRWQAISCPGRLGTNAKKEPSTRRSQKRKTSLSRRTCARSARRPAVMHRWCTGPRNPSGRATRASTSSARWAASGASSSKKCGGEENPTPALLWSLFHHKNNGSFCQDRLGGDRDIGRESAKG
jgi:hypothetical protein